MDGGFVIFVLLFDGAADAGEAIGEVCGAEDFCSFVAFDEAFSSAAFFSTIVCSRILLFAFF